MLVATGSLRGYSGYRGMGDIASSISSIGGGATSIARTASSNAPLSTQVESGIASGLLTAAPFAGPAAPFLAAAGAAASLLAAFGVGSGCGQSCVLSTQYANQAEAVLKQNLSTYQAQNPRYYSAQQAALGVVNAVFNDLRQQCSNPSLGSAGQRCISERLDPSGCKWKDQNGQCWNWVVGYYNPIANDPTVQPDPVQAPPASADLSSILGGGSAPGASMLPLLVIVGLVAVAVSL